MKSTVALSSVLLAALAVYPLAAQDTPNNDSKPAQGATKPAPQAHPSDARPEGHPGGDRESQPAGMPRAAPPQDRAPQEQRQAPDQMRRTQQEQEQQQRAQHELEQQHKNQERNAQQQLKAQQQEREEQREDQRQQGQDRRTQNSRPTGSQERRIPDDRFRAHFGREHHFRVNRPVVVEGRPRFQYSGYWFELVDVWPADWSYDDDCYIDYVDDEYWLFNPVHPGVRVALVVEF
jgi:hypothetical protein